MSTAATAEVTDASPPKTAGKKKLIIIIAAALLLVLAGGGTGLFLLKKRAAAEAEAEADEGGDVKAAAKAKAEDAKEEEKRVPPIFVPLDPFTVNLADRDAERYAQVGVTLQIEDAKVGEELKLYMPAIRNNILMLLAHKNASELLTREGKLRLAQEIRREAMRPLGVTMPLDDDDDAATAGTKKKKRKAPVNYPIKAVQFANIIIQ
ncbi:flagellar basal body-associated FliL family protein [Aquincola sp. S2]|uniref:Flagellar protein FliL n=1 Tax=Pseudaquabacterium terrae TaxID=2732868 RepID=A0ABX2EIR1_9BURK|nr:flagellar basal body-associated FliL family protein [Aquabacterium terrae]NRF68504.1 flagellar basal body-associated FliL family protein [Aquabacterium terrae]